MRNTMIKKLLLNGGKWETVEGIPPLTLEKSLGKYLRDYKIYGNSIQNGTSTPVEVKSVGEKTVNLIPYPYANKTKTLSGITFTDNGDGSISVKGTATADAWFILITTIDLGETNINAVSAEVAANDKYTVSKRVFYNARLKRLSVHIPVGETVDETIYPMLVEGVYTKETIPPYEPFGKYKVPVVVSGKNLFNVDTYQEPIKTNIYLTEPLRKVGEYADYVDFANGKVVRQGDEGQLEEAVNLPKLPTLKGTTVYIVDTTIQPSNMSVVYKKR